MCKTLSFAFLAALASASACASDTDGDRMPDAWESRFPMSVANPLVRDGGSDADADGWGNYAECRSGSAPDSAGDAPSPVIRLRLTCEGATNGALVVRARLTNGTEWAVWRIPAPGTKTERTLRIGAGHLLAANIPVVSLRGRVSGMTVGRIRTADDGSAITTVLPVRGDLVMTEGGTVVGDVNRETGLVRFRKGRLAGFLDARDEVEISATVVVPERRFSSVVELGAPDAGSVRGGSHFFEAWCDDGNGVFDVDEPYGYAVPVDVGWHHPTVEIPLTRLSAAFDRIDIQTGRSARNDLLGGSDGGTRHWKDFVPTNLVDRYGLWSCDVGTGRTRVRIVPAFVAGTKQTGGDYKSLDAFNESVPHADFHIDASDGYAITEGRILSDGALDVGFDVFEDEIRYDAGVIAACGDVTKVAYRVVIGDGDITNFGSPSNAVNACTNLVVREFEREIHRTPPQATRETPPTEEFGARPTFCWRCDETNRTSRFGCSYTAFEMEIARGGAVVHRTGLRRLPARDSGGVFRWKSDAYFGDQLSSGLPFDPGTYGWRVSMHNSKFKDELFGTQIPFNVTNDAAHVYRTLGLAVKYLGSRPNAIGTTNLTNQIRIAAFDTADFTGEPIARTFVRNASGLAAAGAAATLTGLDVGTCWIVGWLDLDGDFVRDEGEPWGCHCDETLDPLPVAVRNDGAHPSSVTIEIKD